MPELEATVAGTPTNGSRFESHGQRETGRTITAAGDLAPLRAAAATVTVNRLARLSPAPPRGRWPTAALPGDLRPDRPHHDAAPDHARLNNGQELSAEGTLALNDTTTGQLDVHVAGVNLTELGAPVLSPRQLAGTLSGDARITGGPSTRNIVGNIKVLAGIVDGYAFQSLDTLVDYRGDEAQGGRHPHPVAELARSRPPAACPVALTEGC